MDTTLAFPSLTWPGFSWSSWFECSSAAQKDGRRLCDLWSNAGRCQTAEILATDPLLAAANIGATAIFERLAEVIALHDPINLYGTNDVTVPIEVVETTALPMLRIYLWDPSGTKGDRNYLPIHFCRSRPLCEQAA